MSGVKILHVLIDLWKSIPIHQNYTMALKYKFLSYKYLYFIVYYKIYSYEKFILKSCRNSSFMNDLFIRDASFQAKA